MSVPAPTPEFDAAERWYFALLQREVAASGSPDAAVHLRHFLRARPAGNARAGGPMLLDLQQRITECDLRLNRNTGELMSWYLDFLAVHGDQSMPAEEALKLAEQVAKPPSGARLESSGYETMADRCFYRARWSHVDQGLQVEGDYIEVLVNGKFKKVFSLSRIWRVPNLGRQAEVR